MFLCLTREEKMIKLKALMSFIIIGLMLSLSLAAVEKIERGQILSHGEDWQRNYAEYEINEEMLKKIKNALDEGYKIDVYLGLWCKDSLNNVPLFIKIIDALDMEGLRVNYFSVERSDKQDTLYFVPELKVERVPTFIFYCDDAEIGRIIENPEKSMIEDFLNIVL